MKLIFTSLLLILFLAGCKKVQEDIIQPEPDPQPQPSLPTVTTYPYSDLTRYSVKIKGNVSDTGGSKIIEAGFVVDTFALPTVSRNLNKFVRSLEPNGDLNLVINDIPASKTYYLRAYASNADGTGYGNEIEFTAFDEKIYKGHVALGTQEQVNEFGKHGYTGIDGRLEINGTVTDLTPLKNLAEIYSDLTIKKHFSSYKPERFR